LFFFMGSGANFVLPTALVQEVPYFENNLPEKVCISTYMNLVTSLGLISMFAYLYVNTYVWKIPYSISVPAMMVVSTVTSFVVAGVYPITVGGISLLLYFCCFIGGSVGALSSVIMSPFLTVYSNDNISVARAGGTGFTVICALVAAAQSPGSSHQRFSASIYLIIFGILLSLSIPSYYCIIEYNLGRRSLRESSSDPPKDSEAPAVLPALTFIENDSIASNNPMMHGRVITASFEVSTGPDDAETKPKASSSSSSKDRVSSLDTVNLGSRSGTSFLGMDMEPVISRVALFLVPESLHVTYPWLRRTVPYMLVVGWVNFNTWGILSAMIPFAIAGAYDSNGAGYLGIALQVGAVLLVLGDISTTYFKLDLLYGSVLFTILSFVIYVAALKPPGFHSDASGPFIIIIFAMERFIESHLCTTAYRAISTDFPLDQRKVASEAVGIITQVCTTVGALLSTLVVTLLFSCG
jgi:hypothetical protein